MMNRFQFSPPVERERRRRGGGGGGSGVEGEEDGVKFISPSPKNFIVKVLLFKNDDDDDENCFQQTR